MSVPAHSNDDSLSGRVAPEWFQPELCVPSDSSAEPVWTEVTKQTELATAPEWLQPELCVPCELTAEPVRLEVTKETPLAKAPEWFQAEVGVPSNFTAEPVWLEVTKQTELTPAEIWSPDYEEDITLQTKPAEEVFEEFTEDTFANLNAIEASRQIRILDELQFLPSEASFATVSINEQIAPAADTLQEPFYVDDSITIDRSKVRLLDETEVLQDEQSFATLSTDQPRRVGAYSPQREFLLKTGLSSTQLMLAKLLVVSAVSVAVLLFMILARGVFNSPLTMTNASHTAVPTLPGKTQAKAVTPSGFPASVPASNKAEYHRPNSLLPGKDETKLSPGKDETKLKSSPELAPKPSRDTVTSNAPRVASKQKEPDVKTSAKKAVEPTAVRSTNSTSTSKKTHSNEKAKMTVRRATGTHASDTRKPGARVERKPAASSTKAIAENTKDKATVSVVSGGGQRPRRVTP